MEHVHNATHNTIEDVNAAKNILREGLKEFEENLS